MIMFLVLAAVALILSILFMCLSKKSVWNVWMMSSFECGFSSYFYSRFSFSIHYFLVGLIFLFLDLELCLLMPFMVETFSTNHSLVLLLSFVTVLLLGLLAEWGNQKLDWNF